MCERAGRWVGSVPCVACHLGTPGRLARHGLLLIPPTMDLHALWAGLWAVPTSSLAWAMILCAVATFFTLLVGPVAPYGRRAARGDAGPRNLAGQCRRRRRRFTASAACRACLHNRAAPAVTPLSQVLDHGLGLLHLPQARLGGEPPRGLRRAPGAEAPPPARSPLRPAHSPACQTPAPRHAQTQEMWSFVVPAAWLAFFATPSQLARAAAPANALLLALFLLHYLNRCAPGLHTAAAAHYTVREPGLICRGR